MRYQRLDALRGLLALSILFLHALGFNAIAVWWGQQQLSVNAFIVISGFVTTLSLSKRPRPWAEFVWDRCVRLFPIFWVCLGLTLALYPFYHGSTNFPKIEAAEAHNFWPLILVSLPLAQGLVPTHFLPEASMGFLPPAWFCSLLLQFCLVAPWIVRNLKGARGIIIYGVSLLILLDPVHWRFLAYWSSVGAFLPQKAYLFILGGLLYNYCPEFGRGRAWRPLVSLGEISYPLFLVHFPILAVIHAAWPEGGAWTTFALGAPISILAAWGLHLGVERPCSALLAPKGSVVADGLRSSALDHRASANTIQG